MAECEEPVKTVYTQDAELGAVARTNPVMTPQLHLIGEDDTSTALSHKANTTAVLCYIKPSANQAWLSHKVRTHDRLSLFS